VSDIRIYSGLDAPYGWRKWCTEAVAPLLPKPVISPTCKRNGHDWTDERVVMLPGASMRACKRCAKRGLVVFETTQDAMLELEGTEA
jgi:hypothetical protein